LKESRVWINQLHTSILCSRTGSQQDRYARKLLQKTYFGNWCLRPKSLLGFEWTGVLVHQKHVNTKNAIVKVATMGYCSTTILAGKNNADRAAYHWDFPNHWCRKALRAHGNM